MASLPSNYTRRPVAFTWQGFVDWDVYKLPVHAQACATALLTPDPEQRLGASMKDGAYGVKAHKFFADIDFVRLVGGTLPAPYVPHLDSAVDTRHCQDEDDMDFPEAVRLCLRFEACIWRLPARCARWPGRAAVHHSRPLAAAVCGARPTTRS